MTKDQLIERHRDINLNEGWWESTYESFSEDMALVGIEVEAMYFSGFSCQGDGACFEGYVSDWALFLKTLGYDQPILHQHAKEAWSFTVRHEGHYYHSNSTRFNGDLAMPDAYTDDAFVEYYSPYPPTDFRTNVWLAVIHQYSKIDFEELFSQTFRDHMDTLYKRLEEEHDYLTSDEVVWETIEANDLHNVTEESEE
jgi:hypothetical protein